MTFSRRLWITVALVLIVQFGVLYVEYGNAPAAVTLPSYKVSDLPDRLGEWESTPSKTSFDIARAVGADATEERNYTKSGKPSVSLHFGIWSDPETRAPHLPQYCYAGNGWQKVARDMPIEIKGDDGSIVTAVMMTWQLGEQRVKTLHWYRRGDRFYCDWDSGCQVRRELWGESDWPAVQKVLLQTDDDDKSRERLEEVASEIHRWMQAAR